MLSNKNAVIYGPDVAIGGAVARTFAWEGARPSFTGRTLAKLDAVANEISATGASVETAEVDALNKEAIENQAQLWIGGRLDFSFPRR
jgi:NADP-dependent 3-hydroxy acid dehydrogenase YdfG